MLIFKKFQAWCVAHFRPLFFLLMCGLITAAIIVNQNAWLLKSQHLPHGPVSWQLNTSDSVQRAILQDWKSNTETVLIFSDSTSHKTIDGIKVAEDQNKSDYLFITFYTLVFALLFLRLAAHKHVKNAGFYSGLIILACVTDIIENLGTYQALHSNLRGISSFRIFLPATIKWLCIVVLVTFLIKKAFELKKWAGWIKLVSDNLLGAIGYLWQFRIVFITLILFFLVLFLSDQGQDLLVTINGTRVACVYFLFSVTVLAALCWHLPKAIDNAQKITFKQFWLGPVDFVTDDKKDSRPSGKVDAGRLLGCIAFVIPAAGILQTMQKYHIEYPLSQIPPMAIPIIVAIIYSIILQYNIIDKIFKKGNSVNKPLYWGTVIVLGALILCWGISGGHHINKPDYLIYLSLDLLIISLIFLITTTLRTCDIALNSWKIAPFITFSALALGLIFVAFNFRPVYQNAIRIDRFWTMPVVFSGVAGYLLFFAFLMYLGKRRNVQYVSILLVITTCFAVFKATNYHNIIVEQQKDYKPYADSLENYATNWLRNRRPEIAKMVQNGNGQNFPVFFVNAHGGGIRAAAWTSMIMGTLDSLVMDGRNADSTARDFQHYVFSCSGASGGSVGFSLVIGSRIEKFNTPGKDRIFYPPNIKQVFTYDYLTADVVGLLGRDAIASAFGLSNKAWDDRSKLQEEDWERHCGNKGIHLGIKMHDILNKTGYEVPLFFPNTYDAKKGQRGVIASLILDSLDFPGAEFPEQEIRKDNDLRLSTAAFLSARFPYVSPTAKLYGEHNYTDGGTWDNSAAETSGAIIDVFERARAKLALTDTIYKHVGVHILSLPNGIKVFPSSKPAHLFEPLAPPSGILSLISTIADAREGQNYARAIRRGYTYTQIRPTNEAIGNTGEKIWPVLPLGWQISDFALDQMQKSLVKNKEIKQVGAVCRSAEAIINKKN
ncbi:MULTISPECIES: hypothetical protein [unclassified Mucilaginibacter]|uniref:hypothetical protein n=1 Tax=unclassified Mucilaginibacter TaxID=2617802 RepID=UPI002AC89B93|nr:MULTISPECIES: hypothetical protein [unclassified Mucilaginibacter]MEB0261616.1 hypothetical protein [Mucilaginibacter sp. 10I4]MEB0278480.1 hypothetical protein [Mucilaginibacter sp. 10B2]MEB0300700.1 hypothetical protein [Mucilaginibacter sp. 5C4]WPX23562.1 hypothetical protein RHM67_20005 [Mucilaginibacter sp. 5C4]